MPAFAEQARLDELVAVAFERRHSHEDGGGTWRTRTPLSGSAIGSSGRALEPRQRSRVLRSLAWPNQGRCHSQLLMRRKPDQ